MTSRSEFVDGLLSKYGDHVNLTEHENLWVFTWLNRNREIEVLIPRSGVLEFFISIRKDGSEIFTDWFEVIREKKESKAELEATFHDWIEQVVEDYLYRDFEVYVEGRWLKTKEVRFV